MVSFPALGFLSFDKVCAGLQWNGLRHWMGFWRLEILWLIIFIQKVVCTALYPNRKAGGHFNSCCPQSIAFGASGEFQQGQAKKSLFIPKRPELAFCRPVPYCAAAAVLGEGSGLAVRAHCHRPPYLCFSSKPPLFSRLLSPWCVSSLESDL